MVQFQMPFWTQIEKPFLNQNGQLDLKNRTHPNQQVFLHNKPYLYIHLLACHPDATFVLSSKILFVSFSLRASLELEGLGKVGSQHFSNATAEKAN